MAYGTVNADVIGTSVSNSNLGAGNASNFKNRIINGSMVISQYNGTSSVTPSSGTSSYVLDRYQCIYSQPSKFSVQQNAGSVTPPVGFINYMGFTSLSAYSNSGEIFSVQQRIEGLNVADLAWGTANAKTVTLSMWVYSSLTGTFGGSIANSAQNRSYPYTYTVPSANTWTQVSVVIPGDTTGTWLTTNGVGVIVNFNLGSGSTWAGTAGSWAGADYRTATGANSIVGTNGATFYITGVQLEVGSSATGFEYRDYGRELILCQRYYETLTNGAVLGIASATLTGNVGASWCTWFFKQTKRTSPTFALGSGSAWVNVTPTVYLAIDNIGFNASNYFYSNGTAGNPSLTASAEL